MLIMVAWTNKQKVSFVFYYNFARVSISLEKNDLRRTNLLKLAKLFQATNN